MWGIYLKRSPHLSALCGLYNRLYGSFNIGFMVPTIGFISQGNKGGELELDISNDLHDLR
jgi:hypothetical protein